MSAGPHTVSDVEASDFVNLTVDEGNYEPSQVGIQNVDSLRVQEVSQSGKIPLPRGWL